MKTHESLSTAKALIGLLCLSIVAIIFYKFTTVQDYLFSEPETLRNFVIYAIVGGGLLIGLLYLTSQTTHKAKSTVKNKSKGKKK